MIALRCQFCRTIYRKGDVTMVNKANPGNGDMMLVSHGICPACQAELDAVSDDELPDKRRELVERYEDRRRDGQDL